MHNNGIFFCVCFGSLENLNFRPDPIPFVQHQKKKAAAAATITVTTILKLNYIFLVINSNFRESGSIWLFIEKLQR